MQLNKVFVSGNLTRDPEQKALPSGQNICNVSIATNESYTKQTGEKVENTEYHNIVVFGKQAENTAKYLTKGSSAMIEGKLQTRSWEKDGIKQYRTEIIAQSIQFGPRKQTQETTEPEYQGSEVDDVDVPF